MLADLLGQGARIDAVDGGDAVVGQPLGQRLLRGPVRVLPRVRADDQAGNVDVIRLKVLGQAVVVDYRLVGDAVVADEGVGQDEDLTAVRRVGEGLRVADHAGVEHHLAGDRGVGPERPGLEGGGAVGQVQVGLGALCFGIYLCVLDAASYITMHVCSLSVFVCAGGKRNAK